MLVRLRGVRTRISVSRHSDQMTMRIFMRQQRSNQFQMTWIHRLEPCNKCARSRELMNTKGTEDNTTLCADCCNLELQRHKEHSTIRGNLVSEGQLHKTSWRQIPRLHFQPLTTAFHIHDISLVGSRCDWVPLEL